MKKARGPEQFPHSKLAGRQKEISRFILEPAQQVSQIQIMEIIESSAVGPFWNVITSADRLVP